MQFQNLYNGDGEDRPTSSSIAHLRDLPTTLQSAVDSGPKLSETTRNVTMNDLRKCFHLPITEVTEKLGERLSIFKRADSLFLTVVTVKCVTGLCATLLKRVCRAHNIKKWPYRQIKSIAQVTK